MSAEKVAFDATQTRKSCDFNPATRAHTSRFRNLNPGTYADADNGVAINQASPLRKPLIIELLNCVETIYISTRAVYANCSYEVTNSAVQAFSEEMMVEGALKLLRESASAVGDSE